MQLRNVFVKKNIVTTLYDGIRLMYLFLLFPSSVVAIFNPHS